METIFILEDDESLRELVAYALNSSGFKIHCFEFGSEMEKMMEKSAPDLILLDIMLPEEDGLSILKNLRTNHKTENIPVIMLTAKGSELDRVTGLDLGADDYIAKPFSVLELIARVKAVLRRVPKQEAQVLTLGDIKLDLKRRIVTSTENKVDLTFKEFELLNYLLLNINIVLSREQIMEKVWGFEYEGQSRTVDMHINTLRQKLGDCGNLIHTVRSVGYKIGE